MANRKEIGKTPTLKTIPKQPNPARNPAQIQYQTGPALLPLTLSLGPAPQPNTARPALGPSAWPQASSGARVLFPAGPRPARALSPAPVPARAFPHAQAHRQQLTARGPLSPARTQPSPTNQAHPVSSFLPTRATTGPILAVVLAGFPTRARTPRLAAAL